MSPDYIIVQAGGKGTRLKHLTRNKPKALVPIDNLPMIFHLFHKYPDSHYIIIGDYQYHVLERYLAAFAEVRYEIVCAGGHTGTCAGIKDAVGLLPENQPFMLIWSDLILPESFEMPDTGCDYVGVAKDFPCRWKYENHVFEEQPSDSYGVAGLFFFADKSRLLGVPDEGEFVRWLSGTDILFQSMPLYGVREYGLLSEYEKLGSSRCRPFNRTYIEDGLFVKKPVDEQGRKLAQRETAWYQAIEKYHFKNIPDIVEYDPLKMEYVAGKAIYEYEDLSHEKKLNLLRDVVDCLKSVHSLKAVPADRTSFWEAYIGKTFDRLEKVRELVPFAGDKFITVNGRKCRNVFFYRRELENAIEKYFPCQFKLIHGDCTFSNMMMRDDGSVVLIDPRGYFGHTELYGDTAYDWAKLYYSVVGNYDQFNRKRFELYIGEKEVKLQISSNGWEDMEQEYLRLVESEATAAQIHLLHAIIWLSLTTYAWEDYDSICGAFYNGLYYLEEAFDEKIF